MQRNAYALIAAFALVASVAPAQTVRFTTSVGAFDMVLNPTGDANLQPLVDNMLANVAAGVYHQSWVNRADPGFVLQLGSFSIDSVDVDDLASGFGNTDAFDPVTVDADGNPANGLDFEAGSNTAGTVSLALSAGNPNSGSASFFVNVGDNSGSLDPQGFVPFAFVEDLTVVNEIMAAPRIDVGAAIGQGPGSLPFSNAPTSPNGDLIMIETAAVVSSESVSFVDPLFTALGIDPPVIPEAPSIASPSLLTAPDPLSEALAGADTPLISPGFFESSPASVSQAVPEPGALVLAGLAASAAFARRRR